MGNEKIQILWTGGFDSTFRMVQLSRKDVIIEPHYVSDNRKSEQYELNAIAQITKVLTAKPETRCTILPLVYVPVEERISHPEIDMAFKRLLENRYIYIYIWVHSIHGSAVMQRNTLGLKCRSIKMTRRSPSSISLAV